MVVGNMTQAYEVAYAEVYCGEFREVKYTHGVEISLSHETLGMPGKNETILTRITTKTRPSDAHGVLRNSRWKTWSSSTDASSRRAPRLELICDESSPSEGEVKCM